MTAADITAIVSLLMTAAAALVPLVVAIQIIDDL